MSTKFAIHRARSTTPSATTTSEKPSTASTASTEVELHHKETHVAHSDLVKDCIIGFSDGLTVPFALTAGLSNLGNSRLVILAGLAELFSGAISMGLGAFLAGITDAKHYQVEQAREWKEVRECPKAEEEEIYELLGEYGIGREACVGVVESLKHNEDMWVKVSFDLVLPGYDPVLNASQFMMDHELKLQLPSSKPWIEGLVMGISYMIGGLLPMIPYFCLRNTLHALYISIGVTAFVLLVFGFTKAKVTGTSHKNAVWSSLQTLLIGASAAAISWGIVRGINSIEQVHA
jgi:VIT1/CCC1 family predicted Fe2+/Mn2+ transporter